MIIVAIFYGCFALFGWKGILIDAFLIVLYAIYLGISDRNYKRRREGAAMIGGTPCHLCDKRTSLDAAQSRAAFQIKLAVERGLRPPKNIYRLAVEMGQSKQPRKLWEVSWCEQAMGTSYPWTLCPYCAGQVDRYSLKKAWQFWK
jgi:hypothetical protein